MAFIVIENCSKICLEINPSRLVFDFEMIDNCRMSSTLERIRRSIARQSSDVVLRRDLMHLGSSARVDAALGALVADKRLIRLGMGVYAKTRRLTSGVRVLPSDFSLLAEEALQKLGVEFDLHPVISDYRSGLSDQIPVRLVIAPKSRVTRKLSVGQLSVKYVQNFSRPSRASAASSGFK